MIAHQRGKDEKAMMNYCITDKWGQTAVVLGHTPDHAADRCYKMYGLRAVKVELIAE